MLRAADLRISTTRSSSARLAFVPAGALVLTEPSSRSPPAEFVAWLDSVGAVCPSGVFPATDANLFVETVAEGVTVATSFTINSSIRFSPSCFRKLLVTLITTANIGISANSVPYASADARIGHRFRAKLRPTITQKCTKRLHRETLQPCGSALSSNKETALSHNLLNLEC